ncbi:autotransporter outer membrane beta-barrel domain-containing protein [Xenorhabdus sp. PB62.4]|uniref:autotransporter outer membrane beta-barrel domain-containing protein n=1 Tax=Xenorhabdus sp. PB62.4 TaxID=1851573 RepID=UPI0016575F2F|nr:autotransporter domain-containing protein [Xenorhabdus sp. PB62.4]MBC8953210.1 outer membrane esterase [Xenorhabdus sp. PB62.4]
MKKAFLFTPALLALSINAVSTAHAYNQVYVFGDSLSDGGNIGRYTTDQKQIYAEYIAKHITRTNLTNSDKGGTNYAQGGATSIGEYNKDKLSTQQQVDAYLNKHNNKADPNGIYIHWVGGNDLDAAITAALKYKDLKKAEENVGTSAKATVDQIKQLVNAGAGNGLMIVPTVPDVGTTPELLEQVITSGINKELKNKSIPQKKINSLIQGVLKEVHTEINKHEIPNSAARDIALKKVFHELGLKAEGLIPGASAKEVEKELTEGYEAAKKMAKILTDIYNEQINKQIKEQLSQTNANIMRIDINGLLREVIADPLIYGFQNTLGYACPQGESASECNSGEAEFTKDRQFVFADNKHPSELAQEIEGQLITSSIQAPSQVMTLTQVNRASVKSALSSLDGHLQQLRSGGNPQGKIGVFGSFTGTRDKTFTLGSDYQLIDNLRLGAMYSNYKEERSPVSNFTYEGRGHIFTAYALWNYYDNGWLSGDVHYSRTNYDSLTRAIQLGKATRRETGSTTGKQWGARITAGWDIPVTNYLTTSPIIQYAWDKGDIDGYRESGNNSSSMNFSDQSYTSKVGTLGWRVDTNLGRFNPYASIQFNHQFGDTKYKLRSGMNTDSTKSSFVTESSKQSTNWRQYTVGVNANLTSKLRGFASVTRNDGNAQDPNYNFSLGINASF